MKKVIGERRGACLACEAVVNRRGVTSGPTPCAALLSSYRGGDRQSEVSRCKNEPKSSERHLQSVGKARGVSYVSPW
jgi:hypothetical protein